MFVRDKNVVTTVVAEARGLKIVLGVGMETVVGVRLGVDNVYALQPRQGSAIVFQMATVFLFKLVVPPRVEVEVGVTKLATANPNPVLVVVRGAVGNKIAINRKADGGVRMQAGFVKATPTAGLLVHHLVVTDNKPMSVELPETAVTVHVVPIPLPVHI